MPAFESGGRKPPVASLCLGLMTSSPSEKDDMVSYVGLVLSQGTPPLGGSDTV